MHPLTLYDVAVLQHRQAADARDREHALRLRRQERASRPTTGRRAPRAAAVAPHPATA